MNWAMGPAVSLSAACRYKDRHSASTEGEDCEQARDHDMMPNTVQAQRNVPPISNQRRLKLWRR